MTDIPYLEPLWIWLRNDETLKKYFTEKSFFMPHHDLVEATQEAIAKDCPAPRALWILPQDTLAVSKKEGCKSPGTHTFHIELLVQCIRSTFEPLNKGGELRLGGQFMLLVEIRKAVKKSVVEWAKDYKSKGGQAFGNVFWVKDQMLYPNSEIKFLATAIQFEVTIY